MQDNLLASILISSHNRLNLFKRSLYAIEQRPPSCSFEVVVADEDSSDNILAELQKRSFRWKFIKTNLKEFEDSTGIRKFWNCSALTTNAAFRYSEGDLIFHMGNEIIPWGNVFDELIRNLPSAKHSWCLSNTWDVPQEILDKLDEYGSNLSQEMVNQCSSRVLSNSNQVPNYLSLFTRSVWEDIGGYNELFMGGIGAEDADFVRRAQKIPKFQMNKFHGLSLHQFHGGQTHLYKALPDIISQDRLLEGAAINRRLYLELENEKENTQLWPIGSYGIKEIISNGCLL